MANLTPYAMLPSGLATIQNPGDILVGLTNVMFTQTNTVTYANSVTATNLIGTGIGTSTLPANLLIAGRMICIKGRGVFSTAVLAPSIAVNLKLGTTQLATVSVGQLVSSAANWGFDFEVLITCRTTGASGTVIADGSLTFATSASTFTTAIAYLNNAGATTTLDTTAIQAITINGTWGTASASNTLSVTNASIEILN